MNKNLNFPDIFFSIFSGNKKFYGFIGSVIEYSVQKKQWEIRNSVNDEVLAFMNSSKKLPIGEQPWYFVQECKEHDKPWRLLNLHKDVKFPGHFCCKNGQCLETKYVCDTIPHCNDKSDEDESICSPGINSLDISV